MNKQMREISKLSVLVVSLALAVPAFAADKPAASAKPAPAKAAPAAPAPKAAAKAAAPAPKLSGFNGHVAQGGKVPLVASGTTAEQWQAKRPQYADLKPRVRTNKE